MSDHHTFDPAAADKLEDVERYKYVSRDELVGALAAAPDAAVVDLGSGTGFYTRDVAASVGTVHAVDVQEEMHDAFAGVGVPADVDQVTARVSDMPFADDRLDGAYSTMTFHEFVGEEALAEVRRVLAPGARFAVFDWSAEGSGERGPPLSARYGPADAAETIADAGFDVVRSGGRPETFVVVATA